MLGKLLKIGISNRKFAGSSSADEERVRDREARGSVSGQRPPSPASGHEVEGVHDREQDERRRVWGPDRQHHEDHERRDHERRDRALNERRLALPARPGVLHADPLEEPEDAPVEATAALGVGPSSRPPGVCSPSSPCGRKTRIRMRIPKTIELRPRRAWRVPRETLVEVLDESDQEPAENGARKIADPAQHRSRESDEPEREARVELDRRRSRRRR